MISIILSAGLVGLLVYGACVIWPLHLLEPTGLIAAMGCALGWGMVLAVYLDSRKTKKDGEK